MSMMTGTQLDPAAGTIRIEPSGQPFCGEYTPPGDGCITHRALVLGALALGPTHVMNTLESAETVATRRVLAQLGVSFATDDEGWLVISRRERTLMEPQVELDCACSLPTLRLMAGVLAGQRFAATLTGDDELLSAECRELVEGLRDVGAEVECQGQGWRPPLRICGRELSQLEYTLDSCSVGLKDPLLLAGLSSSGITKLSGATNGQDHLERLLKQMGVNLRRSSNTLLIKGRQNIHPRHIKLPGDISMAAPMMLLAALEYSNEPVSSFRVRYTPELDAFNIAPNMIPQLIDEFPLAALLATQANGISHLKDGCLLRQETPDMLQMPAQILRQFGADVEEENDGLLVHGPTPLAGAEIQCAGSRRLVLLAVAAALLAKGPSTLHGAGILEETCPGLLASLTTD
jgi:3-phosphoshikimate 1-carboxyvinyltransferase